MHERAAGADAGPVGRGALCRRPELDGAHLHPGDGVAPLKELLSDLRAIGFRGMLSLELFNREYWKQDPLEVAKRGLAKMKAVTNVVQ